MTDPLVTVAMPLYNAAASLETALGLIRGQTYRNLDILLLDNASTDATPEICARAASEDARVRVVRQPRNLGPTANFNRGLQLKRGEFFMWAAHDDQKLHEFVFDCVAALQRNPEASMACTWTTLVTPDGERLHKPYSPAISSSVLEERLQAFLEDRQCVAFYGLYRSAVLDAIGPIDPWLDLDRRYLFKALIRGPFAVVPKVLFRFGLFGTVEDYVAMGIALRPGAADYDLDLYHHFPRLLREAGVPAEVVRRCRAAMMVPLRPYLDDRATFLIGRCLSAGGSRATKLRALLAFAGQYPPLWRRRLFWGAIRRALSRDHGGSA